MKIQFIVLLLVVSSLSLCRCTQNVKKPKKEATFVHDTVEQPPITEQDDRPYLPDSLKETNRYIPFSYKILAKDSFPYKVYKYETATIEEHILVKNPQFPYKYEKAAFDKTLGFVIHHYDFQKPDSNNRPFAYHDRAYFELLGKKYVFDRYNEGESYLDTHPRYFSFSNAYVFTSGGREYFLLLGHQLTNSSKPNFMTWLFDITDRTAHKEILYTHQGCYTIDCFGDFNQDGKLDFVHKIARDGYLTCKTLVGDKFVDIPNYYITTTLEYEQRIDLKNSKWFFDLGKK